MAHTRCKMELIARVGTDPEIRYTPSGVAVTNFSVAVNDIIMADNAPTEWKALGSGFFQLTTWYKVTCWRKLAEIVVETVNKGDLVVVDCAPFGFALEGTNRIEVWNDREGDPRADWTVKASRVKVLARPGDGNGAAPSAESSPVDGPPPGFVEENEIPF